jgi:hypothetical protein
MGKNHGFISFQGEKIEFHQFSIGKTMVSSVFIGKNQGFISFQWEKTGFHQFSMGKNKGFISFQLEKPWFNKFSLGKTMVSSVFKGKTRVSSVFIGKNNGFSSFQWEKIEFHGIFFKRPPNAPPTLRDAPRHCPAAGPSCGRCGKCPMLVFSFARPFGNLIDI